MSKRNKVLQQLGHAEISIELKNNMITIYHPEDLQVLAKWKAQEDCWSKIWKTIDKLVIDNKGYRYDGNERMVLMPVLVPDFDLMNKEVK